MFKGTTEFNKLKSSVLTHEELFTALNRLSSTKDADQRNAEFNVRFDFSFR